MYSSIPNTVPGNVVSQPFQAQQTSEFGDEVGLTQTGYLSTANVGLSSWACQTGAWQDDNCNTTTGATFSEPITFNVYAVNPGPTVGALLETKTQTFNIPYRPSASGICTGSLAGEWYDPSTTNCYNGYFTTVQFDMSDASGAGTLLPSQVIWSVQYNTSQYGPNPYGPLSCESTEAGCPYDALNVGLSGAANTGTDVDPNGVFWNTSTASDYCDGGTGGHGTFRHDTPCWTGYVPMASLQLFPSTAPVISAQTVTVPELNTTHDVTVPVTLDHPYGHTVTVQWRTQAETAKAPSDYSTGSGTVTFAPGQTTPSTPLTVSVNGDSNVEPNEHFQVYLMNPSNASLVGSPKTLKDTVTLLNDDLPTMRASTVHVTEGSAATVTFTIGQVYYQPITINLTLHDGTAIAPGDYGPLPSSSITIPMNAKSATVTIPTHVDGVTEKGEYFTVSGSSIEPMPTFGKVIINANNT